MANGNGDQNNEQRIKKLEAQLKKQKSNFRDFGNEMAQAFANAFGDASDSVNKAGDAAVNQLTKIRDLSSSIKKNKEQIDKFNTNETFQYHNTEKLSKKIRENKEKVRDVIKKSVSDGKKLSNSEKKKLASFLKQNKALKGQSKDMEIQNELMKTQQKQIDGVAGVFKAIAKIPIVGNLMDASGAAKVMQDTLMKTKNSVLAMGAGLGHMVKSGLFALPGAMFGAAVKELFAMDTQLVNVGKQLNMNRDAAAEYALEVNKGNDNLRHTRNRMMEAQTAANQLRGLREKMNDADLQQAVELLQTKTMDNAEVTRNIQLAKIQGKSLKQSLKDQIKAVKVIEKQNKISLDYQKIMKKVATIGGDLRKIIGMVPSEMAAAVAKATSLGMELESITSITDSLLNFESSIAKELEAELLTGKQLNLEKARMAALIGDEKTLMEEINANMGPYAEWNAQTQLAKEAQAAALGMTAAQMEEIYLKQLDIAATDEIKAEANEAQTLANMTQVDLQTMMQLGIEKFAETIQTKLLPHMKNLNKFFTQFEQIGKRIRQLIKFGIAGAVGVMVFNLVKAIGHLVKLVYLTKQARKLSIAGAIAEAFRTAMKVPGNAISFGALGLAIAAGLTAAIITATKIGTADDLFMPPSIKPAGYGQRTLTGPEGSLMLNNKDFVMATTNPENLMAPPQVKTSNGSETSLQTQELLNVLKKQGDHIANLSNNSDELKDKEDQIIIEASAAIDAEILKAM